ncbi:site-specific integrase [Granulosicoccus sp.]|nr:site-specific integrase [Granulosicoccus sp.]MDB4222934.1 site-specific integrase [Granulosicoccus sp.]
MPATPETPNEAPLVVDGESSPALLSALASARDYATASRSNATWRAYRHDWQRFVTWCESVNQTALPASATTICAFIATEADSGLAVATLTRRLAAIKVVHEGNQQSSAHNAPVVREVMRGIRNRQKGRLRPKKTPLIDTDMTQLVDTLDTSTLAGTRDRAMLLIGFAAALRRSELVGIDVEHLTFGPERLTLTIPFSKTDQIGKGSDIAVPAITHSRYCPVKALKAWLALSGRKRSIQHRLRSMTPSGNREFIRVSERLRIVQRFVLA